jgi:RNase P/RNase MRP subunit POP5
VTATTLKTQLINAVKQFLGTQGAAYKVDILKFQSIEETFILRCVSEHYVQLRAALTVANSFEGLPCAYHILRASPNLLTFTANSRTFMH